MRTRSKAPSRVRFTARLISLTVNSRRLLRLSAIVAASYAAAGFAQSEGSRAEGKAGMRILVVGSGGREHALCWSIAASPLTTKLFAAPGNAGIAEEAECVPIAADDVQRLTGFAREQKIDFVVVGPEAPLVLGLVDRLAEAGITGFGPSAAAAALEGSKGFMKDLCARHGIPTAAYARFHESEPAKAY